LEKKIYRGRRGKCLGNYTVPKNKGIAGFEQFKHEQGPLKRGKQKGEGKYKTKGRGAGNTKKGDLPIFQSPGKKGL